MGECKLTRRGKGETPEPEPVLPDTLQQVTYIQSSGSQYIESTYIPSFNTKTKLSMAFVARNNNVIILGSNRSWGTNNYCIYRWGNGSSANGITGVTNNAQTGTSIGNDLNTHEVEYTNSFIIVDTERVEATPQTGFTSTYPIAIFAINNNGTINEKASLKLYYLQFYDSDTKARDFVPCYAKESMTAYKGSTQVTVSAGTAGLYDLIGKRFYVNSGSGSFTIGEPV